MPISLEQPLHEVPFVLFDLESTGLDPQIGHRVCEFAAIRIQGRTVLDSYETLIDPQRAMDPQAFEVNGITQTMLYDAPTFDQVIQPIQAMFQDAVLVAHNAYFDVGFMITEFQRYALPPINQPVVDTLALARRYIKSKRYNLGALASRLGVRLNAHRAMNDVKALQPVFEDLLDMLYRKDVRTLDDLLRAQRGLLPGDLEGHMSQFLWSAINNGRELKISYRTNGGEPIERQILPVGLIVEGKRHLLHAFCYLRNAPRSFSLDRLDILVD